MATKRSAEEVQRLLDEYRQGGEGRTTFCRQGIPVTTLDYYLRRQALQARPRLARVKLTHNPPIPPQPSRWLLRNGRRVETNWNFRGADLARLIRIADSQ
uniref:Uncharacterized protein n=1 Tax=Solibacter usitatus (strain Ellin6076) TaxID=234267 RepID=Q02BD3_SOLUE